jgi:regulator of protease activity HflC (stomatin/prohibitin superfamily)
VSYFRRRLTGDECAVVISRRREPEVIRGPGSVRTFQRWKRVVVVGLRPFRVDVSEDDVAMKDGTALTIGGTVEAQVVDPVQAALRVVDYRDATRQMFRTAIRAAAKERSAAAPADVEAEVARILTETLGDWGLILLSVRLDLLRG